METMVEGWRYLGLGCRSTALEEWKHCCTMADGWRYQCLGCTVEGQQHWKGNNGRRIEKLMSRLQKDSSRRKKRMGKVEGRQQKNGNSGGRMEVSMSRL